MKMKGGPLKNKGGGGCVVPCLVDSDIPGQWKHLDIVPIPKKEDLTKVDNYNRGIIVSKTLNAMILNRIKPAVEELLRVNQNGFRESRSTTSHILGLRRILVGAWIRI